MSDGYDESDTEDANPDSLSKAVLTSQVLEVQSLGEPVLQAEVGIPEEDEGEEEEVIQPEKRARVSQDDWKWKKKPTSFNSRHPPLFPEGNFTAYNKMSAKDLVDLFFPDEILASYS